MGVWNLAKFTDQIADVIRYLAFLLGSILVLRLIFTRLYRNFPRFATLVAVDILLSLGFVWAQKHDARHILTWYTWNFTIRSVLYVLAIFELYDKILKTHQGLAALGRKAVGTFGGIAIAGALIWLYTQGNESAVTDKYAKNVLLARTMVMVTLMIFVGLVFGILLRFPIRLTENSKAFGLGFTVYFASKFITSATIFLKGQQRTQAMNLAMAVCEAACFAYWLVKLSKDGEQKSGGPLRKLSPQDQEVLLSQLDRAERQIMRTFGQ